MGNFPFSAWPYISVGLLMVGIFVRYSQNRKRLEALHLEIAEAKEIFAGNRWWRGTLLFLASLHLGLLFFPTEVQRWNARAPRLYFLEGVACLAGLSTLVGCLILAWHYFGRPVRAALVELGDAIFLSLLLVAIISGLAMAIAYRWASTWSTITVGPYLTSLFSGRPSVQFVMEMPVLVRMHVFSAFSAIAVLPFTRLSAVILLAIHALLDALSRPATALGQAIVARLRNYNPAARIWPEED